MQQIFWNLLERTQKLLFAALERLQHTFERLALALEEGFVEVFGDLGHRSILEAARAIYPADSSKSVSFSRLEDLTYFELGFEG